MAPKRRRMWLGVVLAVLVLCAAAVWLLWPAGEPITVETYQGLLSGMTRGEVEALLGGPGKTRQDFVVWLNNRSPVMGPGEDLLNEHRDQPGIEYWYEDSGIVVVRFDAEDRVAGQQFLSVRESALRQRFHRLRQWLGL
jgi:hypothetical protein